MIPIALNYPADETADTGLLRMTFQVATPHLDRAHLTDLGALYTYRYDAPTPDPATSPLPSEPPSRRSGTH